MSHLLSRILLTIFMLPLAALVYTAIFVISLRITNYNANREMSTFLGTGVVVWVLIAGYWLLLWGRGVRWNGWRINATWLGAVGSIVAAAGIGLLCYQATRTTSFAAFITSTFAPLFWLVATVFVWRESRQERIERLTAASADTLVCPACGYNLTGLAEARCPECGARYTLSELVAAQPKREQAVAEMAG